MLAADTLVVCDGRILGKPASRGGGGADAAASSPAARTRSSPASAWSRRRTARRALERTAVTVRAAERSRDRLVRRPPASRSTRRAPTTWTGRGSLFIASRSPGSPSQRRRAAGADWSARWCARRGWSLRAARALAADGQAVGERAGQARLQDLLLRLASPGTGCGGCVTTRVSLSYIANERERVAVPRLAHRAGVDQVAHARPQLEAERRRHGEDGGDRVGREREDHREVRVAEEARSGSRCGGRRSGPRSRRRCRRPRRWACRGRSRRCRPPAPGPSGSACSHCRFDARELARVHMRRLQGHAVEQLALLDARSRPCRGCRGSPTSGLQRRAPCRRSGSGSRRSRRGRPGTPPCPRACAARTRGRRVSASWLEWMSERIRYFIARVALRALAPAAQDGLDDRRAPRSGGRRASCRRPGRPGGRRAPARPTVRAIVSRFGGQRSTAVGGDARRAPCRSVAAQPDRERALRAAPRACPACANAPPPAATTRRSRVGRSSAASAAPRRGRRPRRASRKISATRAAGALPRSRRRGRRNVQPRQLRDQRRPTVRLARAHEADQHDRAPGGRAAQRSACRPRRAGRRTPGRRRRRTRRPRSRSRPRRPGRRRPGPWRCGGRRGRAPAAPVQRPAAVDDEAVGPLLDVGAHARRAPRRAPRCGRSP